VPAEAITLSAVSSRFSRVLARNSEPAPQRPPSTMARADLDGLLPAAAEGEKPLRYRPT